MYSYRQAVDQNAKMTIDRLLRKCHHFMDKRILKEMLLERRLNDVLEQVENGGIKSLLGLVVSIPLKQDPHRFLAEYLERLKREFLASANCGCWYSAEEGILCSHDWEVMARAAQPQH